MVRKIKLVKNLNDISVNIEKVDGYLNVNIPARRSRLSGHKETA